MPDEIIRNQKTIHFELPATECESAPYSACELESIKAAFGAPIHNGDWLLRIQGAADEFTQIKTPYRERKKASTFREEARNAANKIDGVLGLWSLLALERREIFGQTFSAESINVTNNMLASLRDEFRKVDEVWGGHNVPRNPPRDFFIMLLCKIWEDAHGKLPARKTSTDTNKKFERSGIPYASFHIFVKACLSPIDSEQGLDDIIKKCLVNYSNDSSV